MLKALWILMVALASMCVMLLLRLVFKLPEWSTWCVVPFTVLLIQMFTVSRTK
jgi:hypothetical protein